MNSEITVGIAEDHPLTRLGLVSALNQNKDINVLFDVANGKELLDKLKSSKPTILLLDIEMPIMRAQDVLEMIRSKYPKIKVIIISAFYQADYIIECFKLGVCAFLPKGDSIEKVLEVIHNVEKDGVYTDAKVSKILADELYNLNKISGNISLTPREREIVSVLCKTTSSKQTAEDLEITLDGLNYHLKKIMNKTGTKNTKDLIKYALENRIVITKPE